GNARISVELRKFHRTAPMEGVGGGGRRGGNAGNSTCRPRSGVLCGHRVLVGILPDILAEETSAPSPRGETRSDFAHRNGAARRSLLLRLVLSDAAETVLAGRVRVASGGMGPGSADRGHRRYLDVAGNCRRAPFGQAMGSGRAP